MARVPKTFLLLSVKVATTRDICSKAKLRIRHCLATCARVICLPRRIARSAKLRNLDFEAKLGGSFFCGLAKGKPKRKPNSILGLNTCCLGHNGPRKRQHVSAQGFSFNFQDNMRSAKSRLSKAAPRLHITALDKLAEPGPLMLDAGWIEKEAHQHVSGLHQGKTGGCLTNLRNGLFPFL